MQKRLTSDIPPSAGGFSRFTFHEGIRILVPGFYFSTLLFLFYSAFLWRYLPVPSTPPPLLILFSFVSLIAGLTMYATESPKRRKAFLQNQPSQYILEQSRLLRASSALDDHQARRLYFYILNNYMPSAFHEKVFFFGTVYHIMILFRRTSFWFALAGLVTLFAQIADGLPIADVQELLIFTLSVTVIYLMNVRHNKADRKMQENYQDQIFWLTVHKDLVDDLIRHTRFSEK